MQKVLFNYKPRRDPPGESKPVVQNPENHRGKLGGVAVCCVATGFIPVVPGISALHDQSPRPTLCHLPMLLLSLTVKGNANLFYTATWLNVISQADAGIDHRAIVDSSH